MDIPSGKRLNAKNKLVNTKMSDQCKRTNNLRCWNKAVAQARVDYQKDCYSKHLVIGDLRGNNKEVRARALKIMDAMPLREKWPESFPDGEMDAFMALVPVRAWDAVMEWQDGEGDDVED